ncbi:MAG: M1 family aminopeptidase [Thaumarchaeota archaeon]|nr:M1 family aminopeptidase [Nitrososphaerota archaeon]
MNKRKSFHIPGSFIHRLPDKEYRTEHIKVQLKVDPEEKSIAGSCSLKIVPIGEGLRSFRFDAREMHIARVRVDGAEARFDHDGATLTVRTGAPMSAAAHEVVVEYSAKPIHGVYFIHPDEAYPDKPTQVWTQSEAEAARFWFPCHDHPDDRSTTETIITVPDGYQVISTGKLVSRSSSAGWSTFDWNESAPHSTYLNSFVVGKFVETNGEAEGVPLQYYVPEAKRRDTTKYFGLTPDMMRTFVEVTGYKFPFEKYAQVAVHDFIYGGMENISATTLVDNRFPDERSEEDYAARYSRPDRDHIELVAHELAHSWFGDLVTLKHWPHAWLNEGFATYMEAVYHERKYGKDDFRHNMQSKSLVYFEEDEDRYRRAIVESDYLYADDLFDAYAYEKASWMIHQLRYILGDEVFFKGVQEYLKRFAFKNPDTHDFMRSMEETSGLSLEGYFEQSFYMAGHPELEAGYSWDEKANLAQVEIKQVQRLDEQTPIFQFPCDVVFYTEKGRQSKRVWVRSAEEKYSFELGSEPTIVEIDPEGWLLKKLSFKRSRSLLVNQLESSQDALSRRQAAESLASFKDDEAVEALKRAANREQHWSVRAEAAGSMGKVGGPRSLDALLELRSVRQRKVRRSVIAALSEFKGDARVHSALKEALFHDESPYVQCEAALSLAKSGAPDAVQVLREAMRLPSPEDGLTEASLEALGMTKKEEVRETLRENVPYGKPTRVRVGALKGYVKLGTLQDADVELLKKVASKDRDFVVRFQALMSVGELHDRRFVDTLSRVAEEDLDNRCRRKAIEVLVDLEASEAEGGVLALKEEVEKLNAENREIKERLSKVEGAGPA